MVNYFAEEEYWALAWKQTCLEEYSQLSICMRSITSK